jgi:hypothetical protein
VTGVPAANKEKVPMLKKVIETKVLAALGVDKSGGLQ